jgi:hypothetical protein
VSVAVYRRNGHGESAKKPSPGPTAKHGSHRAEGHGPRARDIAFARQLLLPATRGRWAMGSGGVPRTGSATPDSAGHQPYRAAPLQVQCKRAIGRFRAQRGLAWLRRARACPGAPATRPP